MSCVRHGVRRQGHCPSCGEVRVLPGMDGTGAAICVDCAGITTSFRCRSCGEEGEQWFASTCLRCSLERRLHEVLDDGTGRVAPALGPLFDALASMANPWSGLTWLGPKVRARLAALATGVVPLSHEGIDQTAPGQEREHLRDLLMVHAVLEQRDRNLMAFERWEHDRLESIENALDRQVIRVYLRWHQHRDLAARAQAQRLSRHVVSVARARTNAALRLLGFLRDRGISLERCSQADVDAWFATASNPLSAVDFLRWAIDHRRCARLVVPQKPRRGAPPSTSNERSKLLAHLLSSEDVALVERVAGLLVLLLAQPVTRVCALEIADMLEIDGEVRLRLGGAPVALPQPVGALVLRHLDERAHMTTSAHPSSPWVFPGKAPGQHLSANQLGSRLRCLGVSVASRKASLHHLIGEVPAPVLADALGYHPTTTARRVAELGADWAGYAALRGASTHTG